METIFYILYFNIVCFLPFGKLVIFATSCRDDKVMVGEYVARGDCLFRGQVRAGAHRCDPLALFHVSRAFQLGRRDLVRTEDSLARAALSIKGRAPRLSWHLVVD